MGEMVCMIFLLSGKAESGKNTVAEIIFNHPFFCDRISEMAYADSVKDIAYEMGWDGEKDERGRDFLQLIGDGARNYDKDIWVRKLKDRILYTVHQDIVITDCRYQNEIEIIKDNFNSVYSIRIIRPEHNSKLTEKQKKDSSEISLDEYKEFDFYIINGGDKEELKINVYKVIEDVLKIEGCFVN
jgi:dephospho-CoA kinase